MHPDLSIRAYDPDRDLSALRACIIELQDHEHAMIPIAPTGAEIIDAYIPWMFDRIDRFSGALLLAELRGQVVGYACLLQQVPRPSPEDPDEAHAVISELLVREPFRGQGIGEALLLEAERLAIDAGATNLRLTVVGDNEGARRLYKRLGFEDVAVSMWKRLDV